MATRKRTRNPVKIEQPVEQAKPEQKPVVTVKYKSMHSIQFELNGKPIKINGSNEDLRGKSTGVLITDFGTTTLPRKVWEDIENKYGSMSIFKNGLIFAYAQPASAQARAEENAELKTGFEPVEEK